MGESLLSHEIKQNSGSSNFPVSFMNCKMKTSEETVINQFKKYILDTYRVPDTVLRVNKAEKSCNPASSHSGNRSWEERK